MTAAHRAFEDPVALARRAILDLIDREHAVTAQEIEARLCEQEQPGVPRRLDPLDVRLARDDLEAAGHVVRSIGRSAQSSRTLPLYVSPRPADVDRLTTVSEHKRDLLARYLTWSDGDPSPIRSAADRVVHESFQVAAPTGYRVSPTYPVDVVIHETTQADGAPGPSVLMPVEVRNTREWLGPHQRTPYPLLLKATRIQVSEQAAPIMPMFVCRRAHPRLVAMGRDLGFHVMETRREFILPSVSDTAVAEVRSVLGFVDLTRTESHDSLIVSRLGQIVPGLAQPLAERWRRTALSTIPLRFSELMEESTPAGRRRVLREIRATATAAGLVGAPGTW